ncbi:MAG: tetratricopeptide repeat protein [Myxococcota bacterium]
MTLVALWLWLVAATASAIGPTRGVVVFGTSPDADVVVYPRNDPRRIDVMVRNNRMPIDRQTAGMTALYLQEIEALAIGGGTWFVKLWVDADNIVVNPKVTPGRVVLYLEPGTPKLLPPVEVPTVEQLLTAPPPRQPLAPAPIALTFLRGGSNTLTLRPQDIQLDLPIWDTGEVPPDARGWMAIDVYRARMIESVTRARKAELHYRLGLEHLGLGWYREAAYYFEAVMGSDTPYDIPAVALAAARAHLALGRPKRARELCQVAGSAGATAIGVLQCIGAASLLDGFPSPTHVGRALLANSNLPEHRLLAGQLILSDHRFTEARRVLEAVAHGEPSGRVMASLGDARYATGDVAGAKLAWLEGAAKNRRLSERIALRVEMAAMLEGGASEWATYIPRLIDLSERKGFLAAEAHYLLAQIAEMYGDPDLAAEHLNRMWDRFPSRVIQSDVPERLVEVCNQRLSMLARAGRSAQEVSFFLACWRQELDMLTGNPEVLQRVAMLLSELGLPYDALALQQRALLIHTRLGSDDPAALAQLTRLYVATGKPIEALETLEYAEGIGRQLPAGQYLVAEAEARLAAGDVDGALQAYQLADAEGMPGIRRTMGLVLAEEGRCEQADRYLAPLDDGESRLAHGRCLIALGRNDEAAERLPSRNEDPLVIEDASWMSGVLATRGAPMQVEAVDEDDALADAPVTGPKGIWSKLKAEEEAAEDFRARLEEREQ